MYCSGNEESLFDCNRNIFSVVTGYCKSHYYDVGLKCERMLLLYYCTLLMLYNQLIVNMEQFVYKMAIHLPLVALKCVLMVHGVLYVVISGIMMMLVLYVDN